MNADVRVVSPVRVEGELLNMSAGGIRIAIPTDLPCDEACLVEVWITSQRCHVERARVVWSQRYVDGWVFGLEFLESSPEGAPEPQA